ncbi:MAG TPA: DUF4294 domain-containing protein [Crocinitomicaceae bacterium]|nr:DUF4294 domain-containing protein [Crocinitomicaceae bacterium]
MLKITILTFLLSLTVVSLSQDDLAIAKEQDIPEMRVDRNFKWKYKRQLELLRRTYPMALKAKELIDDYENDLDGIERKRKKKRYSKKAHKILKEEFTFNIKDLYQSEGELLMKLVYRETGMTVNEVIKNYRGGFQTAMYGGIAKMFGQDLDATYSARGDDWITEAVINDIDSGTVKFDKSMRKMDKAAYKESMKDYRANRKKSRKKYKKKQKKN